MEKRMHPIKVSTKENGEISICQEWNYPGEEDPEIIFTSDQAGSIASWVIDAATEVSGEVLETEPIPVEFYSGNPDSDSAEVQIYTNNRGMVVIKISEESFIEVSPSMAKRLRSQLTKAISVSLTDMFRSDEEV